MGGLDTADGYHLFGASRAPISTFWTRAFVLGLIADLYDQSLCRKNRSGCTSRARGCDKSPSKLTREITQRVVDAGAMFALGDVTARRADSIFNLIDGIRRT